ncbi:MAG: hypothetical protein DRJ56_08955 [Thermoprotei archaeon]|nr:MAG: hypothetical protein DRJ56_08955 [Thermoprotei archaeon]
MSMSTTTISLRVKNWGPIREGFVTIEPLTVFIGPNNTGKSYLAMLLYALVLAVNKSNRLISGRVGLERELVSIASALVDSYFTKKRRDKDLIRESERLISEALSEALSKETSKIFPSTFKEELERVYSSEIGTLVRLGSTEALIELRVSNPSVDFLVTCRVTTEDDLEVEKFKLEVKPPLIEKCKVAALLHHPYLSYLRRSISERTRELLREDLRLELTFWLFRIARIALESVPFGGNIHYLPASRAGVLHSYRSIAKALVSLASIAPVRGVEIPGIPGPLADFLGELILVGSKPRRARERNDAVIRAIAQSLEEEILEGEITLLRQPPEAPPALVFKFDGGSLPIARVSSMIAEAAPLSILLKYGTVRPGDTLIVEEPEAHLHPDKQAKLAVLFAKLVNEARMRLLITTHSEILLAKLSNLVSLSAMPHDKAREIGYDPSAALSLEKIAVYSFEPRPGGVVVVPVKVTREGIPDDVFQRVIEDLYEETMSLYYRLQELRGEGPGGASRDHDGAEGRADQVEDP